MRWAGMARLDWNQVRKMTSCWFSKGWEPMTSGPACLYQGSTEAKLEQHITAFRLHAALHWMQGLGLLPWTLSRSPNHLGRSISAITLLATQLHQYLCNKGCFPLNVHVFGVWAFVTTPRSWEQPWDDTQTNETAINSIKKKEWCVFFPMARGKSNI